MHQTTTTKLLSLLLFLLTLGFAFSNAKAQGSINGK